MIVKYIGKTHNMPEDTDIDGLVLNKQYLAVALRMGPNIPWVYLHDPDSGRTYPSDFPLQNFEIVDSRFSSLWKQGFASTNKGGCFTFFAQEEWANDIYYHGRLFEGCSVTQKRYEDTLQHLLSEFSLPWVTKTAVSLKDGNWVTDENFECSWEANPELEMTVHPETKRFMHNPIMKSKR